MSEAKSGHARLLALADPKNTEHPTTTFVYQDRFHELYTARAGAGVPIDLFVAFLRPLDISDSKQGIQAVPKKGTDVSLTLHFGATLVPDVADVTAYFTPDAIKDVPAHPGRQARGGRLWKLGDGEGVLLLNDSVATTLHAIKSRENPKFASLAETVRITRTAR